MRLYVAAHILRYGYSIDRCWSDEECAALPAGTEDELRPVRFIQNRKRAFEFVARWNRRFATH